MSVYLFALLRINSAKHQLSCVSLSVTPQKTTCDEAVELRTKSAA